MSECSSLRATSPLLLQACDMLGPNGSLPVAILASRLAKDSTLELLVQTKLERWNLRRGTWLPEATARQSILAWGASSTTFHDLSRSLAIACSSFRLPADLKSDLESSFGASFLPRLLRSDPTSAEGTALRSMTLNFVMDYYAPRKNYPFSTSWNPAHQPSMPGLRWIACSVSTGLVPLAPGQPGPGILNI